MYFMLVFSTKILTSISSTLLTSLPISVTSLLISVTSLPVSVTSPSTFVSSPFNFLLIWLRVSCCEFSGTESDCCSCCAKAAEVIERIKRIPKNPQSVLRTFNIIISFFVSGGIILAYPKEVVKRYYAAGNCRLGWICQTLGLHRWREF